MNDIREGESIGDYVARRIDEIFNDVAVIAGEHYAKEFGEDMPTGALAFELMKKSMQLQEAWKKIREEG